MEKEIRELIDKHGFTLWATVYSGKKVSAYKCMDKYGINLIIEPEEKNFYFVWSVPKSIFTVNCPSCSPFDNEQHFTNIYYKFRATVLKIKMEAL